MDRGEDMAKEWESISCAYCSSIIPFIKIADIMQVKCRKCSKLQTVNLTKTIEVPKVVEEPKVITKLKKNKFSDFTDITDKNIDYKLEE